MIYPDHAASVGRTPLVELARLAGGLPGRVLAKLEPGILMTDAVAVAVDDQTAFGLARRLAAEDAGAR